MKDLLSLILTNITTHPQDVQITESGSEDQMIYTISVNPEDMGRVIGKNGKVIKAIRSIAHVIAIRQNTRFRINVAEVDEEVSPDAPSTDQPEADAAPETDTDTEPETLAEPEADPEPEADAKPDTIEVKPAPVSDDAELISGAIDVTEETSSKKGPAKDTA